MTETQTLMTMREWLCTQTDETTGLPLARPGKGRFSRAARSVLADAMIRGMSFSDDEDHKDTAPAPRAKSVKSGTPAEPVVKAPVRDYDFKAVRKWAEAEGMTVSQRGRVAAPILVAYDKANPVMDKTVRTVAVAVPERPRVRPENVAYGLSKPEADKPYMSITSVAFEKCHGCSQKIGWCKCENGPVSPKWLNGGEVASLTKP